MKIYVLSKQDLTSGLDVARILGADVALVEKSGGITAAYILTSNGDRLMEQTKLRKHASEEAGLNYCPIPFILDNAKAFLESNFAVEYLLGEGELEEAISLTVRKILASSIAVLDTAWLAQWTNATSHARGVDTMRMDLAFMEKVHAMRSASMISATSKEVREMAEEIVLKNQKADWNKLASQKGKEIVTQQTQTILTQSAIIGLQEGTGEVHRFDCQQCGRPATVTDSSLGADWKAKRFIAFTSSCNHPNRFNVAEFIQKYCSTAFR